MIDLGLVVPDREDHSLDMVDTIQGSIGISEVDFKSVKDFNYFNMNNSAKMENFGFNRPSVTFAGLTSIW